MERRHVGHPRAYRFICRRLSPTTGHPRSLTDRSSDRLPNFPSPAPFAFLRGESVTRPFLHEPKFRRWIKQEAPEDAEFIRENAAGLTEDREERQESGLGQHAPGKKAYGVASHAWLILRGLGVLLFLLLHHLG